MTKVYKSLIESATDILQGGVGVIPTDTLYGLVAKASNQSAVARLYLLKSRDGKPGTIIASSIEQLIDLGLKRQYLTAVKEYWPGAVSIIIPTSNQLAYLHLGKYSLAVRVTDKLNLLSLLDKTGPLLSSSANTPGDPPAVNIKEANNYFGDLLDFYVEGGIIKAKPSTVIRMVDDVVEVVRRGSVTINEQTGEVAK